MEKYVINGGKRLKGKVKVSGSKNAALALMPACLLSKGINKIENVPEVNDIYTMTKLFRAIGVNTEFKDHILEIDTSNVTSHIAPYEHVKKMRASVYVLGPLLTKYGKAKVSMPGGCAWGPRPINLHLEAMKKLGADIDLQDGYIIAKTRRLKGGKIHFDISSVGATGNALMAAVLAKGTTLITNAAVEPEITVLVDFLISMGAKIKGRNTTKLEIEGVDELQISSIKNVQDRIEAGTLLIAGALTKSNITLEYYSNHIDTIITKLEDSGAKILKRGDELELNAKGLSAESVDVSTAVYPGFPTDMQAQWTVFMSLAKGTATITDYIYFDRFKHVPELNRLGADIEIKNNSAVVKGVRKLRGAKVMSTDLRASASLVLGGLAAEGQTEVLRIYHIDRGYQRIEEKLQQLGADIKRVKTSEY